MKPEILNTPSSDPKTGNLNAIMKRRAAAGTNMPSTKSPAGSD
jgi:hypothetical protein